VEAGKTWPPVKPLKPGGAEAGDPDDDNTGKISRRMYRPILAVELSYANLTELFNAFIIKISEEPGP